MPKTPAGEGAGNNCYARAFAARGNTCLLPASYRVALTFSLRWLPGRDLRLKPRKPPKGWVFVSCLPKRWRPLLSTTMRKPNEVLLNPAGGTGPLAAHLNRILKAPEIRRARALARLLEGFHLKDTTTSSVDGRRTVIDGCPVVNFGSANYLGLEQHSDV